MCRLLLLLLCILNALQILIHTIIRDHVMLAGARAFTAYTVGDR